MLGEAALSKTCRSFMAIWFAMAYHYIFQFQFGAVGEKDGIPIEQVSICYYRTAHLDPAFSVII